MVSRASAVKVRLTCVMVTLIVGATRQATPETPPIPGAGPLARPKSLQTTGQILTGASPLLAMEYQIVVAIHVWRQVPAN